MRTVFALGVVGLLGSAAAGQVTLNVSMTADNRFEASISTSPTTAGTVFLSGNSWSTTYTGSTVLPGPGTYYLQVRAEDLARPEMLIGFMTLSNPTGTFANGFQWLLTDRAHWRVSHGGFGVSPVAPRVIGINGTSPWGFYGAMGQAEFIWHPEYQSVVYFTTEITVVPAPASLGLLALSALGLRRRR